MSGGFVNINFTNLYSREVEEEEYEYPILGKLIYLRNITLRLLKHSQGMLFTTESHFSDQYSSRFECLSTVNFGSIFFDLTLCYLGFFVPEPMGLCKLSPLRFGSKVTCNGNLVIFFQPSFGFFDFFREVQTDSNKLKTRKKDTLCKIADIVKTEDSCC